MIAKANIPGLGNDLLAIYLNDHYAGSTAGLELARRACSSNQGSDLGDFLGRVVVEIEEDRETLEAIMERLDVPRDHVKVAFAWAGEKAGRLKLNGRLIGYSPLSRLIELEGLSLGVAGKAELWRMLDALDEPCLIEFDFEALLARAVRQREGLQHHRIAAGLEAFGLVASG